MRSLSSPRQFFQVWIPLSWSWECSRPRGWLTEGLKVGWRTTQRSARTGRCHDAALVFQLCLREGKVKCKVKKCEMWEVAVFLRGYKILITNLQSCFDLYIESNLNPDLRTKWHRNWISQLLLAATNDTVCSTLWGRYLCIKDQSYASEKKEKKKEVEEVQQKDEAQCSCQWC